MGNNDQDFSLKGINQRLGKWNLSLPMVSKPVALYLPYRVSGKLIYTSGALPLAGGKLVETGPLGSQLSLEKGQSAARYAALNALGSLYAALSEIQPQGEPFDFLCQIVQLTGYVQSEPTFKEQHLVLNAASELLFEILGEKGRHSRIAVGVSALPLNAPVEIALIAEFF
jgi:enamine deaminase RidA (YjgF/YER057c/UK114 family)